MSEPRRSTVYDLASLRLHTDGTRVYQRSANLRPTLARVTVKDSHGNWIARDAGGSTSVSKYRKVKNGSDKPDSTNEDGEDFEISQSEDHSEGEEQDGEEGDEGKKADEEEGANGAKARGRKRKGKQTDERTLKRRKFAHNQDFLVGQTPTAKNALLARVASSEGQSPGEQSSLPLPSSDLLKCVHHFAANYYTEKGQLLNVSRQYRRERKKKRKARNSKLSDEEPRRSRSDSPDSASNTEGEHESSDWGAARDGSEEEDSSSSDDNGPGGREFRGKGRPKRSDQYRDMYKVFDGSALMAIGILLQEHISLLLKPAIPEGWEQAMRESNQYPSDDDAGLEEVDDRDERWTHEGDDHDTELLTNDGHATDSDNDAGKPAISGSAVDGPIQAVDISSESEQDSESEVDDSIVKETDSESEET